MTLTEWLDQDASNRAATQSAQLDARRLLATFFGGIGTAFTATALEVGSVNGLDIASSLTTGAALLLTLYVAAVNPLQAPDIDGTLTRARNEGKAEEGRLEAVRNATFEAVTRNDEELKALSTVVVIQVAVALAGSATAVVSMLIEA